MASKQLIDETVKRGNLADPSRRDKLAGGGGQVVKPLLPYGVGVDTHSKFIQVCVLVQHAGEVLQFEQEYPTKWQRLVEARQWVCDIVRRHTAPFDPTELRYTIESTGTYHMPVLLAWRGFPSVVNPVLAGPTRRKTDVLDARMLSHQSLVGMWPKSFIPQKESEQLRVLLGMRYEASRNSTRCLNRINNHILRFGHTFGAEYSMADMYARAAIEDMCNGTVPNGEGICPDGLPLAVRPFFKECYSLFDQFRKLKDHYHADAIKWIKKNQWPCRDKAISGDALLKNLMSVPGIGEVSAITWLAVVCDPRRFLNGKQVAAFCGADPSLKVSAGKVTSHVKRKGNARLHHVLKNVSAQLVRRAKEPIGQWGYNIYRRHAKGGWARACNAVSRRLAIFLWQVHSRGVDFSYEQYRFYLIPDVVDVPLETMGLGTRYEGLLREAGLSTSKQVAAAFITTMPQAKGVGAGCLSKVKAWLDQNRTTEELSRQAMGAPKLAVSSCVEPSKAGSETSLSTRKREKRSTSSSTKSTRAKSRSK